MVASNVRFDRPIAGATMRPRRGGRRPAFTLLELMLALALSVLATVIIGNLVQMYSSNFASRGEDIRRIALARSILNMIAEDLRSTVVKQEFDASVLQQMLTGQGGGGGAAGGGASGSTSGGAGGQGAGGQGASGQGAGGQGAGGQGAGGQGAGGQGAGGQGAGGLGAGGGFGASGAAGSAAAGGGQSGGGGQTSSQFGSFGSSAGGAGGGSGAGGATSDPNGTAATSTAALPLGIYGSLSNLTIDVSRLPRPDEYIVQQQSIMSGQLTDMNGDIKSVTYFVQVPTNSGVADAMNTVTSNPENGGMVGGLVRRAIDRAVMTNAEQTGQTSQLMRTGQLIAPEVLSLELSYFDGMRWATTWDSSSQGLPRLIDISLAMQSKTGEKHGIVPPGLSISTMPFEERAAYGIEIYTLTVSIPGAQLQTTTAQSADTAAGMGSVGL